VWWLGTDVITKSNKKEHNMRRVIHETHYKGCTLDDVKQGIADGAMPRANAQIVDGHAKMVISDYLGRVEHNENGERVEYTYDFDWSHTAEIRDYLNEDYEGGFYVV
tara:strand:- start:85 stop:405 length:321 start_codon:yes stop_codon:yes gene_type:complete